MPGGYSNRELGDYNETEFFYIFQNEMNEDPPKSMANGRLREPKYPAVSVKKSFTLDIQSWQLSLIFRALTGTLKNDKDRLYAKKCGLEMARSRYRHALAGSDIDMGLLNTVNEELADMAEEYNAMLDEMEKMILREDNGHNIPISSNQRTMTTLMHQS